MLSLAASFIGCESVVRPSKAAGNEYDPKTEGKVELEASASANSESDRDSRGY